LNEIEIALTVARARLEFDAEQKEILFKDLVERLRQGRLSKTEFSDQCQRLGIRYERCMAYADYYWSKYIGDEFLVITKDERSALASAYLKKFTMGFMTEEELREKLKKLMYTDEEIALRIERALVEDEVKYLSDVLTEADALLKKGEISYEEYVQYLVSLGMREERARARANRVLAGARRSK
jgi:3-phosphoglycerate kinase